MGVAVVVWLLASTAGAEPVPGPARATLVAVAPSLADANLERVAAGHLRLRLPEGRRLSPHQVDDLLAALAPLAGAWQFRLDVVDADGEAIFPESLSSEQIERLALAWRAERPRRPTWQGGRNPGALAGLRVVISAGHGIQYEDGNWNFQRPEVHRLREDLHTNEVVFRHLAPMLERAGADVVLVRERSNHPARIMVDNDGNGTTGSYSEEGAWLTGGYAGRGGTYRYAATDAPGSARATWQFEVARDESLPLYVWYVASANRSPRARYEVSHAAGLSVVEVDQQLGSSRWNYLGTFPFSTGMPAEVALSSAGGDGGTVVIADAIRLGGGAGFADLGGGPSGLARWRQSASTYAIEEEVPFDVRNGTNDVNVRPALALWQGADLYVAIHTNAGGGRGTSSFVYSNAVTYPGFDPDRSTPLPPGTLELQESVHAAMIETFRTWEGSWADRGMYGANFGELRPLAQAWGQDNEVVVPATLVELAFHDSVDDTYYLREDRFRHDAARAILRGIVHFVADRAGAERVVPPLPPANLVARVSEAGIELQWQAAVDTLDPGASAQAYQVEVSSDGRAFRPYVRTTEPWALVRGLQTCQLVAVRVTASNAAGRSMPSRVAFARVGGAESVLWVDGTRRLQRTVLEAPEGPATAARTLADLVGARQGALSLASARVEAVANGTVELTDFDVVLWSTGETGAVDGTLRAAEQQAVATFLANGGALMISGAELGWDLVERGNAADQAFFADVLHAAYAADDAETFTIDADPAAVWLAGLEPLALDDGSGSSFRTEFPDVLDLATGSAVELRYASGGIAALRHEDSKLFVAGFPLESVETEGSRRALVDRVLAALVGQPDLPACGFPYGEPEPEGGPDGDADPTVDGGGGGDADVEPRIQGGCGCGGEQRGAGAASWVGMLALATRRRRAIRRPIG